MSGLAPKFLNRFNVLATRVPEIDMDAEHFHIDVILVGKNRSKKTAAMIDSGASTLFISKRFVEENNVKALELVHSIPLYNIDGSRNQMGDITHVAELGLKIGEHYEPKAIFTVADIGSEDMIIGIDWLRKHNPDIDWDKGMVTLSCCEKPKTKKTVISKRIKPKKALVGGRGYVKVDPEWELELVEPVGGLEEEEVMFTPEKALAIKGTIPPARIIAGSRHAMPIKGKQKDSEEEGGNEWEKMGILAGYTYSQQLTEKAHAHDSEKSFEEMIPIQYRKFARVFSKEASDRMPTHKPYDHAIDLKPEAELSRTKAYPMSPVEQEELNRFIQENLAKGYIHPSESEMASPVFFTKKKDGSLRLVQDYRKLNQITVKNRYPLPLISEIVDKLRGAKYFSKMDVRWGYNNVRIKEGDEHKAAFSTNRGMFEPLVMFFGLTNSPATFQAMMDNIFRDMIDQGHVVVYLDDIIVFTQTLEEHRRIVQEVLH